MLAAGLYIALAWADGALAQVDAGSAKISAPTADQAVAGSIQITGTATDPAFRQFELAYSPDPPGEKTWKPIQPPIGQQVQDGVLGAWDTTTVADGVYWIRLRVVRQDRSFTEDQVRIVVANATATPVPTPLPTATAEPPQATATVGPSPIPLIWQPPTRTPRPSITPGGPTATPKAAAVGESPFKPERLQQAAWNGVAIALGVFGVLGVYSVIRAARRGELRRWWWEFRREVIHPLLNRRSK